MKAPGLLLLTITIAALTATAAETNQPPERAGLEITATFAEFHLKENTAYYSNNVVVVDPPSRPGDKPTILKCNELTATRGTNGRLDNIVALGAVQMDQGDTHARGHRAVYIGTNEVMELTGPFDPDDTDHPLPLLFSVQGTNYGTKIVYERLNDRLRIENVVTRIPGMTLSNTNRNRTNSSAFKTNAPMLNDKLFPRPPSVQNPK